MTDPDPLWAYWLKIGLGLLTAIGSFFGGVFAAGYATAKKIGEFEKSLAETNAHLEKTSEAATVRMDGMDTTIQGMAVKCLENRDGMRKDISLAVNEGLATLSAAWGPELAGAREQRVRHATLLEGLQAAVENQNDVIIRLIIRLHERIDQDIRERNAKS